MAPQWSQSERHTEIKNGSTNTMMEAETGGVMWLKANKCQHPGWKRKGMAFPLISSEGIDFFTLD